MRYLLTLTNFLLYTINFDATTNSNYNPEIALPIDATFGSEYYFKDLTGSLNSCPTYLENLNSPTTFFWSGGATQTAIGINTANYDVHFVAVPIALPSTSGNSMLITI